MGFNVLISIVVLEMQFFWLSMEQVLDVAATGGVPLGVADVMEAPSSQVVVLAVWEFDLIVGGSKA